MSGNLVHCWTNRALRRVLKQGNLCLKVVKCVPNRGVVVSARIGLCLGGWKDPACVSSSSGSYRTLPRDACIKARFQLRSSSFLISNFWGLLVSFFFTQNISKTPFFIIFCIDYDRIIRFSKIRSWMLLVLTSMTLWSSLKGSLSMRRSSRDGGALSLVMIRLSFGDFLEVLLPFFIPY